MEGGQEERLEKLKNDKRMDKWVKFYWEGIRQKEGNKIKMQNE
jgi:hypothetical protein